MNLFYAPDIETTLTLPEGESQHCARVLRMQPGDEIEIIDGHGTFYSCRVVAPHARHTVVEIISSRHAEATWPQNITVAVAPTKHMDRMEWLVEKLTEIGVSRIVPLLCRHSERREIKTERLEKIAISAMKQSLKAHLPEILPLTSATEFIASCGGNRYMAYCDRSIPRRELVEVYAPLADSTIMIGPEGDFSPEEIRLALSSGWHPVSLGPHRLRTETAALTACETFHILDAAAACGRLTNPNTDSI